MHRATLPLLWMAFGVPLLLVALAQLDRALLNSDTTDLVFGYVFLALSAFCGFNMVIEAIDVPTVARGLTRFRARRRRR